VHSGGDADRGQPAASRDHRTDHDCLDAAGHGADDGGALFRPIRNNRTGQLVKALTPDMVDKLVRGYSGALGFEIGAHALRSTAATNALDHQAGIARVQECSASQIRRHPYLRSLQHPPIVRPEQGGNRSVIVLRLFDRWPICSTEGQKSSQGDHSEVVSMPGLADHPPNGVRVGRPSGKYRLKRPRWQDSGTVSQRPS
jgi:hypothetical protein